MADPNEPRSRTKRTSRNPQREAGEAHSGSEPDSEHEGEPSLRGRLESILPDILKRAMVNGLGAVFSTEESIRAAVTEMRLPKEAVSFVVNQADNTKDVLFGYMAKEFGEFLDRVELDELFKSILSSMALEVTTQIRFVPVGDNGRLEPEVSHDVQVKRGKEPRD